MLNAEQEQSRVCTYLPICKNEKKKKYFCKFAGFTGIDQAYEEPKCPELTLTTVDHSIEETVDCVLNFLREKVC